MHFQSGQWSFNNIATSKAPKSRRYGGSDYDICMAAEVLQKNQVYVGQAATADGLSLSGHAQSRAIKINAVPDKQRMKAATRAQKLWRRALRKTGGNGRRHWSCVRVSLISLVVPWSMSTWTRKNFQLQWLIHPFKISSTTQIGVSSCSIWKQYP